MACSQSYTQRNIYIPKNYFSIKQKIFRINLLTKLSPLEARKTTKKLLKVGQKD